MRNRFLLFALLGLLVVCGGCTEDEERPFQPGTGTDIPDSDLPFPATPDLLMTNFMTVYETMDATEYALMLDPAFATHLKASTVAEFPAVGATLDVAEEKQIHGRLFSGEDLTDQGGRFLPAVHQFSFGKLRKIVDWGESLDTDPIPNTLSALYEVDILVDRGQQYSTFKVEGQIRFYVKPASGLVDGQPQTYYRLVGQLDQTGISKSTEIVAWGSLKALYY
jgi:hypothetical protein